MVALLHVVCAGIRPDATLEARAQAVNLALGLSGADHVSRVVVAESTTHLLVATWLDGREALEVFAASPAHMAFIMRGLASVTSGMWSAAVETEATPPASSSALFLFGLRAAPEVYEWQVRALVDDIEALPGSAAAGVTFEERDRFRAAGAVALSEGERVGFEAALAEARSRWGALAEFLESAIAPVAGIASASR